MNVQNDSKQNILNCALRLFSAKGYEAVSVQELVNAAGITKPTLYYYFGSKEGVYAQLAEQYYGYLDAAISRAAVYNPKPSSYFEDIYPVLVNLATAYFTFALEHEMFYRMVLANLFQPPSAQIYDIVKARHFRQYDTVREMFEAVSNVHTNVRGKSKMLTWTFIGMVNSCIGLYFSGAEEPELNQDTAKEMVRQFMHGIHS